MKQTVWLTRMLEVVLRISAWRDECIGTNLPVIVENCRVNLSIEQNLAREIDDASINGNWHGSNNDTILCV